MCLSGEAERAEEARASAEAHARRGAAANVLIRDFPDGFFPYQGERIKDFFEELKAELSPDVVFTHQRADLHQDHRVSCELTWNTFRDHLILEYEVPKYDGDMSAPNTFVPLTEHILRAQDRPPDPVLRVAALQALVPRRTCSRACCACEAWSATHRRPTRKRSSAAKPSWR